MKIFSPKFSLPTEPVLEAIPAFFIITAGADPRFCKKGGGGGGGGGEFQKEKFTIACRRQEKQIICEMCGVFSLQTI